ncbi:MAG: TetR/AcrR family transcriptional regulator [Verrucomicrobiales bacterium]|nr:TetR/AcrR family transcriptional regulator [Verrucomicrobiales bacterium]
MSATATNSRDAVLASATAAFASRGYAGTSVQDILGATGLSKPTLYYYFGSKAGLFRAILDQAQDESYRIIAESSRSVSGSRSQLGEIAAAMFDFSVRNKDLIRLIISSAFAAPEELPPGVYDMAKRQRLFHLLGDVIRAGQLAGELTAHFKASELAEAFFGAITHPIRLTLLSNSGKLDRSRALRVVELFLMGARA